MVLHGLGSSHNAVCQRNIRNGTYSQIIIEEPPWCPNFASQYLIDFVAAILDRSASNVIVPSYKNTSMLYTLAYQEVARQVGSFLVRERVVPTNTRVIGGSLGAQIAGVMRLRSGFRPRDIYGEPSDKN